MSGLYVAKLTSGDSGRQSWIVFVVRDDERAADLMFQAAFTRHQAYNNWGGKSLYAFNSTGPQAVEVSFDRPFATVSGASQLLSGWEYPMIRFLEREGYDVTYSTSIDTHRGTNLHRTRAFLSVGHDEYWSWEMRENVEQARDRGVDLAFFSANTCFWQIRLGPSRATGASDRTVVSYKEGALSADPVASDGAFSNDHLTTTLWRNVPVLRPEESLIGVMYTAAPVDGDIVVDEADHWVFSGTGLRKGDRLRGLLGYEVDRIFGNGPATLRRLGHSPFVTTDGKETGISNMTIYEAPSGAHVFATGSIQWSWGLDDFNAEARGFRSNAAAQQITRNVLNYFAHGTLPLRRRRVARH